MNKPRVYAAVKRLVQSTTLTGVMEVIFGSNGLPHTHGGPNANRSSSSTSTPEIRNIITAELSMSILSCGRPLDGFLKFVSVPLPSVDFTLKPFAILNPAQAVAAPRPSFLTHKAVI